MCDHSFFTLTLRYPYDSLFVSGCHCLEYKTVLNIYLQVTTIYPKAAKIPSPSSTLSCAVSHTFCCTHSMKPRRVQAHPGQVTLHTPKLSLPGLTFTLNWSLPPPFQQELAQNLYLALSDGTHKCISKARRKRCLPKRAGKARGIPQQNIGQKQWFSCLNLKRSREGWVIFQTAHRANRGRRKKETWIFKADFV